MRMCFALSAIIMLAFVTAAFPQGTATQTSPYQGQGSQMYDQSYVGPTNMYGQPLLTVVPRSQDAQPGQEPNSGLFPMAATGLQAFGNYLWGYMPAPVRGVESPYQVPPGAGYVTRQFVPGSN